MTKRFLVLITALFILGVAVYYNLVRNDAREDSSEKPSATTPALPAPHTPSTTANALTPSDTIGTPDSRSARAIESAWQKLRMHPGRGPEIMRSLKSELLAQNDTQETVTAILAFLNSGRDADTGMGFRVGPDHLLTDWPSFRVALLDWLYALSPSDAAAYSTTIFNQARNADEWALAMRALALHDPASEKVVLDHVNSLLMHDDWRESPSAGYVHALDAIVYFRAVEFTSQLSSHVSRTSPNPGLSYAASLVLDRLAMSNPRELITTLIQEPDTLAQEPGFRAGLMARADFRDPAQVALIETYLAHPEISHQERSAFFALFPNHNLALSHNLMSNPPRMLLEDMLAKDQASLSQMQHWLDQNAFSDMNNSIRQAHDQLSQQLNHPSVGLP